MDTTKPGSIFDSQRIVYTETLMGVIMLVTEEGHGVTVQHGAQGLLSREGYERSSRSTEDGVVREVWIKAKG